MAKHDITVTVNGTDHSMTVESETLLIHALREHLDYTGPKVGCQSTMCGACTVHLDGRPVKSCTLFAVQADGASVTTVEGLGDQDDLHPLQETFREEHGLQCGYCTPGMIMTASAHLSESPDPDREEIAEALEGNLCRCTGYENIVDAVESAADRMGAGSDD
jgi:carbon-monoxide dehydrogenase small subunit